MTTFKDTAGREWHLAIDVTVFRPARERAGTDLGAFASDPGKLFDLFGDLPRFCDVLYVLVEDQAHRSGVTDEQFGRSMGGDVFDAAQAAFVDAYLNFCPSQTRKVIRSLAKKWADLMPKAADELVARIESSSAAGNSPASSASTPPA